MKYSCRKQFLFLVVLVVLPLFSFSQRTNTKDLSQGGQINQEAQMPPAYLDCQNFQAEERESCTLDKIKAFVHKNVDYNKLGFHYDGLQRVYCKITIDKEGKVENSSAEGATAESGLEVERVLKKLPRFFPARKKNKPVAQALSFVVVFNKNKEVRSFFPECGTGNPEDIAGCESRKLQAYVEQGFIDGKNYKASEYGELLSVEIIKGKNGKIAKVHATGSSKRIDSIVERIVKKMPVPKPAEKNVDNDKSTFKIDLFLKYRYKRNKKHKKNNKHKKAGASKIQSFQKMGGENEIVPIYPGCEGATTNRERKECLSDKIRNFVSNHFGTKKFSKLELTGTNKIYCQFLIAADGRVVNIRAVAKRKEMVIEAKRVLKKLPKVIPGKKDEKPVKVLYTLPIIFKVR